MASDAIKKVQGKLFRGGPIDTMQFQEGDSREPGLTINIPKPPPTPTPPPKLSKPAIPSPKNIEEAGITSYRERLAQSLGEEYKGAERYRLLQDEKKERHWKRWGPYLSDRQWVCSPRTSDSDNLTDPHT